MSDDSESTKPPLVPNSLDIPMIDKLPKKELKETTIDDTEIITQILNLQIQDITAGL